MKYNLDASGSGTMVALFGCQLAGQTVKRKIEYFKFAIQQKNLMTNYNVINVK